MQNYIITLQFKNTQKRVWLVGDDSAEAAKSFQNACLELDRIREQSHDWEDFFGKALDHLKAQGFVRIKA